MFKALWKPFLGVVYKTDTNKGTILPLLLLKHAGVVAY